MKRIWIFLGSTFALTWGLEFWLMANGGLKNPRVSQVLLLVMMIPALCSLLTRWITHEGFGDLKLKLTWKTSKKAWLLSWFGPAVMILFGIAAFFLIFPSKFDSQFTILTEMMNSMQNADGTAAVEVTRQTLLTAILSQLVLGIVLSPAANILPSLGEELGWRGYLLPRLTELKGRKTATLLTGLIWGIWHAPIIAQGYNYGTEYSGFPVWGILAMTLFCVLFGIILAWLTYSSESVFPAAFAHGALNGFASFGFYFHLGEVNPFLGPAPMGIIGGAGVILAAVWCYLRLDQAGPQA